MLKIEEMKLYETERNISFIFLTEGNGTLVASQFRTERNRQRLKNETERNGTEHSFYFSN